MDEYDFPEYGRQCELVTPWRGYHRGTIVALSEHGFVVQFSSGFSKYWFSGKSVVTFDDVITRGITWATYADQLENLGAHVIGGIFLAKTHYKVNRQ